MLKRSGFKGLRTKKPLTRSKSSFHVGGSLLRTTLIKAKGPRAIAWEKFRNETFENEKDDEGLIRCQDYLIGLEPCGIARDKMDLHHIYGRDGKLLLDRSKMVWLTRECHQKAHERVEYELDRDSIVPSDKAPYDPTRPLVQRPESR